MHTGMKGLASTAILAGGLLFGWNTQSDSRESIRLPAAQRDMVLSEMREMLTSVNGILRGLATQDTALARASASRAGMAAMMRGAGHGMMGSGRGMGAGQGRGMGTGQGRGMGANLPAEFRTLGHATHEAFDGLAAKIASGARADTIVARLATITGNCVACHAAWRLEVSPP